MEKHIQTVLQAVVVGLLIWVGSSTIDTGKSVAVLTFQMTELTKKSDGFITRPEADQRAKARDIEMAELRSRIQKLEARFR